MTTLTINLSKDSLEYLTNLANQVNAPPQDLARAVLEDAMRRPNTEFEQILERLLQKNKDIYKQLASL